MAQSGPLPLAGLRVLDLTTVIVGPTCTWRLAQYGAEIVKVEAPEGDLLRGLGGQSPTGQHSGGYLHLNRGKRNICLNLKKPGASLVMDRLFGWADVVVANMRPDALRRLGIDPETVRAKYPDTIYCLLTGYGTDGPYAGRPTYDSVLQGAAGIAGLFQARDGEPAYVPLVICDHVVGEIAAGAILCAVIKQRAGGGGSSLEVPMFETMAAFVLQEHLAQQSFEPPVGRPGDRRLLNPSNKPVRTADGWLSVTINTDAQVRAFLKATGRDEIVEDPRFASVAARAAHVDAWFEIRGAALPGKTTAEWLRLFEAADIAAMPCHSIESLRTDPHVRSVGLVTEELHPTEGRVAAIRSTIRYDDGYPPLAAPAQPCGWETSNVLGDLGFAEREIEQLLADGAAVVSSPTLPPESRAATRQS